MTAYTIEQYKNAARKAKAAGNLTAAEELAQAGIALQNQGQQPPQNQQPNQTGFIKGAFINAPVRGGIGIAQGFDARKAASSAAKADFYDVNSIENMKRAAASRMNPQLYQQIFESEEGIEYLQVLAGQGLSPTQMLERIQKRNPELGTDFSENGWSGQITSIFNRFEAEKTAKAEEAYKEGEEALSSLAKKEQLKTQFPMSDVGQRGANIYAEAPTVMEWAKGAFKDPLASLAFISEIATESAPSIGAGIATGIITRNPRAAAGIMVLAGAPRTYSGEFVEFLRSQDIDTSDPYAIKAAISNDEILAEANRRGFTKSMIVGFFEGLGMKVGGNILTQAFVQAGTGSLGELGSDIALDGVENIDWKEVVLEGIAELATTPAEYSIIKGRGLFKNGKLSGSEDLSLLPEFEKLAAADVARLLDEVAKANGYKLKNVDPSSSQGAKQALEDVRSSNVQVINDLRKVLKKQLDPKNAQSLEQLLSVYSEASAGIGAGKKKVSQKVTEKQLEALSQLVGDTKEGQQLLQELVKSNVITDLFKGGMKGGVSQFTDLFNPLSHSGAVYDPTRYANVFIGGTSAYGTGGASLGIAAGGRVVDAVTGRRSKVSKFVKNNKKALGLGDPEGTSVIEEKARLDQEDADADAELAAIPQDELDTSPIGTILNGTGLGQQGLETVLNEIEAAYPDNKSLQKSIASARKNLAGGNNKIFKSTRLVGILNKHINDNPDLQSLREALPDRLLSQRGINVQTDMPNMGGGGSQFGAQFAPQENYNRGIQDNLDFVRTLQDGAGKDKKVSRVDRGRLITSLENLTNNLGSNPVETVQTEVQKLQDQGVNQDAIDKYIKPYVDRVVRQQRPKGLQAAADAGVAPETDTDPESKLSQRFNVTDLESARELKALSKTRDTLLSNVKERRAEMESLVNELNDAGVYGEYQKGVTVLGRLGNGERMPFTIEALHLRRIDPNNPLTKRREERLGYKSNIIEKDGKFYVASLRISSPDGWKSTADLDAVKAQNYPVMGNLKEADPDSKLSQKFPALQQPEIPRGETTNIQMPNTLGSAFEFAKNSNFRTGRDFKLELQEKALEAQEKEGIDLSELSEENTNRLADYVLADALEALKNNANAIGWYDRTVTDALNTLSEIYPEILTNPTNKLQFIWALAVTSNGTKVDKNFELAANAYDTLQKTGRFPAKIGIGDAARAIDSGLAQYHTMLNKFNGDHGQLEAFMNSQQPVRDLEKTYGVDISGEGKDTLVRGASILGAKIGNGFFSNLYGNFDALTMDRWLMRTVGRHRGTLIKINRPMIKKKQGEIQSFVDAMIPNKNDSSEVAAGKKAQLKQLRAYLKPSGIRIGKSMTKQNINELAAYIAHKSTSKPWREGLNAISNDLRKSANGLAGYRDGQVEMPAGAKERNFIRSVFSQALDRLNADPAVSRVSNSGLTMSDLQALLWYPEKLLYDSSKAPKGQESRGYKDDEAPDYANAARKLVEARKAVAGQSGLGSSGAAGNGRRGTTSPDERLSQGILGELLNAPRQGDNGNRRTLPTNQEFKSQTGLANVPFEIGLEGSRHENGLKDYDSLRQLAEAYMITLIAFNNQKEMAKTIKNANEGTQGSFNTKKREAKYLTAGTRLADGSRVSSNDAFITAIHEVTHGIASARPDTFTGGIGAGLRTNLQLERRFNDLSKRKEATYKGTFENEVAKLLDIPDAEKQEVISEIINLQDNVNYLFEDGTETEVRDLKKSKGLVVERANKIASEINYSSNPNLKIAQAEQYLRKMAPLLAQHYQYTRGVYEMSVEPIIYYLYDPKAFKALAPKSAELVQKFFKESSIIRFYNHPLALGAAVVLAMLLKQEQAEEEDQQRGILAQRQAMQAGALTA